MVSFWGSWLSAISTFLMSEPIIYFVGLIVLAFIVGIFNKIRNF